MVSRPSGSGPGAGLSPDTPPQNRSVSVGTTSLSIATDRPTRKKIIFMNDSDTVIYLAKASAAALNSGLRVNPDGGSIIDEPDSRGFFYTGPWAAISSAASKVLLVSEEV